MLSEKVITKCAITYYALAVYTAANNADANKGAQNAGGIYSKAEAYINVLALPWSKHCAQACSENLRTHAEALAKRYLATQTADSSINRFLDLHANLNYWEPLAEDIHAASSEEAPREE
jgi:hypothetical protein